MNTRFLIQFTCYNQAVSSISRLKTVDSDCWLPYADSFVWQY